MFDDVEGQPLTLEMLENTYKQLRDGPTEEPRYIVCREDWLLIYKRAKEKNISYFSAYLELLNEKRVRPAMEG